MSSIDLYPPYASLKKLRDMEIDITKETSIRVRLVKIIPDTGETEVLISNLYESSVYSEEDLKEA
jgi:hypothetical protein